MQKSQKKKKKKKFVRDVFLCGFPISGDKRAEKVSGFVFFRIGEGQCEINYKKQKIYFCPFWEFLDDFWSLVWRK